jgi:hypothetical protein
MSTVKKRLTNLVEGAEVVLTSIEELEKAALHATDTIERQVYPIRKSLIKRFPIVFILMVTIGFVLTSFGTEMFLERSAFFSNNPLVAGMLGIMLLVITGAAYKKDQV